MRISELSRKSGVPVPTIKFYIRKDLLPAGRLTSATQASYDEQHLRRLRLIRALTGVRGLSVEATRQVLGALFDEQSHPHLVLGLALGAIGSTQEFPEDSTEEQAEVDALLEELGWHIHDDAPARRVLAETLAGLRQFGAGLDFQALLAYARLAEQTARIDLDHLEGVTDPLELAERALVLTTLLEPALMSLRRLAQENESARRHQD